MPSSPRLTLAVVLPCLLLAGCAGAGGPQSGSPDGSATPAGTPTATPAAPTDSTNETVNAVAYESLSERARAVFDAANDSGPVAFAPESPHLPDSPFGTDVPESLREHDYVTRNGTRYAVTRTRHGYTSYFIDAERVNRSAVSEAELAAPEDLPERLRGPVRQAVETGSYDVPPDAWGSLPEPLDHVRFVRYEGEYYRLGYAVGSGATYVELDVAAKAS